MASSRSPWSDRRKSRGPSEAAKPVRAPEPVKSAAPAAKEPPPLVFTPELPPAPPVITNPAKLERLHAPSEEVPSTEAARIEQTTVPPPEPARATPPEPATKPPKPPKPKGPGIGERLGVRLRALNASLGGRASRAVRTAQVVARVVRENAAEYRARPAERAVAASLPRWADAAVVGLAAMFAISLVSNGFGLVARPEASAVYAASRIAEGARAYVDVPSSSWPGHLALLASFAKIHLGGWAVAQALAALAFAISALCVGLSARAFGRAGRVVAVLAAVLGFEPLLHATRPVGPAFAMPFVAGALLALAHRRPALGGALAALGAWFHPVVLVVAIPLLFKVFGDDRAARRRAFAAFAIALVASCALVLAWGGTQPFSLPWRLSIVHATGPGGLIRLLPLVARNGFWLALVALAPFVAEADRTSAARALAVPALLPVALTLAWPAFDRTTALAGWPLLALAAGLAADGIVSRYARWAADGAHARTGRRAVAALGIAVVASAATDRLPTPNEEHAPAPGTPVPTNPLGAPARALFWSERDSNFHASSPRRLLWMNAERSSAFDGLVQAVSAQTSANDTILGDGALAPLVALATHHRLALDLADDALTRLSPEEFAAMRARLDAAPPALVLATPRSLATNEALRTWVQQGYRVAGTFGDPVGWVYVHVRRR